MRNCPDLSVTVLAAGAPDAGFAVTAAPAILAPVGSVIVPAMPDWVCSRSLFGDAPRNDV
jgi:hypothetical protein